MAKTHVSRTLFHDEARTDARRNRELLLEAASDDLDELAQVLAGTTDETIFGATEFTLRDIVHRFGAKAVETALRERKKGDHGSSMSCAKCQEPARFLAWRAKGVLMLLGEVRVDRTYYHYAKCHHGCCPRDAALWVGLCDLSPGGAAWAVALAGVLGKFPRSRRESAVRVVRPASKRLDGATRDRTHRRGSGRETGLGRDVRRGERLGVVEGRRRKT